MTSGPTSPTSGPLSRPAGQRRVENIRGVLLSHAHMDHNGCLGFLRPDLPVYTGLTTAIIGKCLQDPKPTGADGELCYLVPARSTAS